METNSKRAKVDIDCTKSLIYVIPKKIQKRRLDILVTRSREKGLPITDTFWYVLKQGCPTTRGLMAYLSPAMGVAKAARSNIYCRRTALEDAQMI